MKITIHKFIAAAFICLFAVSCGGGTSTTGDTGSVTLSASVSPPPTMVIGKAVTESATPSAYYVMVYKAEITTDETCGDNSVWTTVYDNSAAETPCSKTITLAEAIASADYANIPSNPSYGQTDEVADGTYKCMRVQVCDQLVAVGNTASCTADYYRLDIYNTYCAGGTSEAQTATLYWSTEGEFGPEVCGSVDDPYLLTSFDVTAGEVTNLDMVFNVTNTLVFDAEQDPACYVEAPSISFED